MNIEWNEKEYGKNFSFVPQYGKELLELVAEEARACSFCYPDGKSTGGAMPAFGQNAGVKMSESQKGGAVPKPLGFNGENSMPKKLAVDLGCGTGALSEGLLGLGYNVIGIDDSADMLKVAKKEHPNINFYKANALNFNLNSLSPQENIKFNVTADVIFSNAVFHWINEGEQVRLAKNIAKNLKPQGVLVAEFGGHGCAEKVHTALKTAFENHGLTYVNGFYFPTVEQYLTVLESAGFRVEFISLFDRPTVQSDGENGLKNWVNMFIKQPFCGVSKEVKEEILKEVEEILRPELFVNGEWVIDYVRIRVKARKKG